MTEWSDTRCWRFFDKSNLSYCHPLDCFSVFITISVDNKKPNLDYHLHRCRQCGALNYFLCV